MKQKKKALTKDEQIYKLKKDNLRFQIEIILIFTAFLALFFFNYNYTVFKVIMAGAYSDTDTLDKIYAENLGTETHGHYFSNFDNAAIAVFTERIHKENKDEFTTLFRKGGLSAEHIQMNAQGNMTKFENIDESTGCLTLTAFSSSAYKQIIASENSIKECDNLIIDLRDNPGGVLKYADKVAELFLPKDKTIATYKYRSDFLSSESVSKNNNPLTFKHIYLLQNKGTASAAEVFINALSENLDNVTIIGETSYGKGIGQTEMKFLGGYGFKATTLKILTPNGNCINHKGITPNKETKDPLGTAKELAAESQ